ncbi:gibberellin 2-beta-dioxygenase 6 [Mercurialis annua]|uniref:gibberellin 2-beta-dioxygenase 6 n=1 Tax=Mercurialis annua TaxID=3986 RepID=UPI0021607B28|nr:gibberellin 2-beta-dioxygenase 6 [Mercurialis annua]
MSQTNLESYPPLFRPHTPTKPTDDVVLHDVITEVPELPLIDLQCLNPEKLGEACKNWGFFRLVNHGIPLNLLTELQDCSKKLLSESFEYKKGVIISPVSYFWGTPALNSSGGTISSSLHNVNWVEGFNVPLAQLPQFQTDDLMLHSFRLLLEEYGEHLARIATTIFDAIAKILNLNNSDKSKSYLSESTGVLRIYRYPKCALADETLGMEAHTDSSVLSILNLHEQVGGLELLKDEQWLHVEPIPNTLIINLGDMMQAISDDEYKSVKHRVKANKYEERLSICYFVFPAEECVIQTSKYKPFTYKDFQKQVQHDIKTTGFKVGLHNFKQIQPLEPAS